jgi:hypothetical protein
VRPLADADTLRPGGPPWRKADTLTPEELAAWEATLEPVRGGLGPPRPVEPAAVLEALPGTVESVAAVLGVTEGAARTALCALLREGRVVIGRVGDGRRRVALWRVR